MYGCMFAVFGFLEKRSTQLQLLLVTDDWLDNMDNGYDTDCIYLDYMKAFDSVPTRRLITKLKVLLTVFKSVHRTGPSYLESMCQWKSQQSLPSYNMNILDVPVTASAVLYNRCFSIAAPRFWNSLPTHIQLWVNKLYMAAMKMLLGVRTLLVSCILYLVSCDRWRSCAVMRSPLRTLCDRNWS